MTLNRITPLLLGSLVWTACSVAGPVAPGGGGPEQRVQAGREFSLRLGEAATTGTLRVGLDAVLSDSRCPKGERCITAGEASVRIWLQQGDGPRMPRELRLPASSAQTADHDVQLLRLEPYPVTGRTPAPGDYVATLVLRPASTAQGTSAAQTSPR